MLPFLAFTRLSNIRAAKSPTSPALIIAAWRGELRTAECRCKQVGSLPGQEGPWVRACWPEFRFSDLQSMVVALLAVLKTGAAYVPLDPSNPIDRLAFMVEDSNIACAITTSGTRDKLPQSIPNVITLDAEREAIDKESSRQLAVGVAY